MTAQSRETKVLVVLLISIIVCTMVLNMLGHNPPSAGAFCLSQYYRLVPVEKLVHSRDVSRLGHWRGIEVYFSECKAKNQIASVSNLPVENLNLLSGISGEDDNSCHFVIHNGFVGRDGQINITERWKKQLPADRSADINKKQAISNIQTIYVCIELNNQGDQPTNFQIKRAQVLVDELCREFEIKSESVFYPGSWQY